MLGLHLVEFISEKTTLEVGYIFSHTPTRVAMRQGLWIWRFGRHPYLPLRRYVLLCFHFGSYGHLRAID